MDDFLAQYAEEHFDLYLYMADVKMHLANHPMDEGDEAAWWLADSLQDSAVTRA